MTPDPRTVDALLAEYEAREKAATAGPWVEAVDSNEIRSEGKRVSHGRYGSSPTAVLEIELEHGYYEGDVYPHLICSADDLAFITHARTDVPRLVKALRAALPSVAFADSNTNSDDMTTIEQILRGEGA